MADPEIEALKRRVEFLEQALLNQEWIRAKFDQVEAGLAELKSDLRRLDAATTAALIVHDGRFDVIDHHLAQIRTEAQSNHQEILKLLRQRPQ